MREIADTPEEAVGDACGAPRAGGDFEATIQVEYLENLMRAYNQFFFHYERAPLLICDTSDVDYVTNRRDFEAMLQLIQDTKEGTRHVVMKPAN